MKTIPSGMQADLNSGSTKHCFCWKLTRKDSTVMGFTDHDLNLIFGGVTYLAATGFTASAIKSTNTLAVDNSQVDGMLSSNAILESDIDAKLYDNAKISIYRVDWTNPSVNNVEVFTGYLGTLTRGKHSFMAELRSINQAVNQPTGRLYSKMCSVDLFSTQCGKLVGSVTNGQLTGRAVSSVFSRRMFVTTDTTLVSLLNGFYNGGLLTWTSGANSGAAIEIKSFQVIAGGGAAWIELWESMAANISAGDLFTIRVGCDKTITTCYNTFNNVVNFRGFPRMPGQDNAVQLAAQADRNDGTSWYS